MKLAVIGSRSLEDQGPLYNALDVYRIKYPTLCIISGGARGVDLMSDKYARSYCLDHICFKPYHLVDNKAPYTVRYFFIRNKQIVDNADMVLAYWDGKSGGTKSGIRYAQKLDMDLWVINKDGNGYRSGNRNSV